MHNQAIIAGRLGRDPELRTAKSGTAVCNLSVAADSGYGDKKQTYWARVVCFDKTAQFCADYLRRGDAVLVVGRLTEREWEKDGQKHRSTEILADKVQSLGRKEAGDRSDHGGYDDVPGRGGQGKPSGGLEDLDDEIPFGLEWQA